MATGHRFPRERRLKRQRLIRPLFEPRREDVEQLRVGPLLVRYRLAPPAEVGAEVPLQVGFAVSRRLGDQPARNRVRRILREAFRQHQHGLLAQLSDQPDVLTMMILYRGQFEDASEAIFRAMPEALGRVAAALHEATSR